MTNDGKEEVTNDNSNMDDTPDLEGVKFVGN
jgi:hypothetical protein